MLRNMLDANHSSAVRIERPDRNLQKKYRVLELFWDQYLLLPKCQSVENTSLLFNAWGNVMAWACVAAFGIDLLTFINNCYSKPKNCY